MTQKEILEHEEPSSTVVHLYREGLFWKAYEYSAYRFIFGINRFKASKKYVKTVAEEVVSIGFPVTSLGKFSELFDIVTSSEKQMTIVPKNIHSEVSFEDWKASVISNEAKLKTEDKHADDDFAKCIIDEINHFNLESKTPMECMMWLSQLKGKLNG